MGRTDEDHEHDLVLRAIAEGDLAALERLYREFRVAVFAVAFAVVRDRGLAEDVTHDTFVRVWERAGTYRPGTRPRAWVLAIGRNLAIDAVRSRTSRAQFGEVGDVSGSDPLERLQWIAAMSELAPREREIVVLHAIAGLTHREIAGELGLPEGTVRWKYRRALARLAPALLEGR